MESRNNLVSIIVATKNGAKYIGKAIEGVLNQTYKNFELLIMDGGSTDNTKEVVHSYLADPRVQWIYKKDKHRSEGLNNGIKISKGDYIAILDDDDFWPDPKKLEKQVNFLEEHPDYILVSGGVINIDDAGREVCRRLLPEKDEGIKKIMLFDCLLPHSAVMFRKEGWELAGGYNTNLGYASEDWDLWFRMGKIGKFYSFPEYLICSLWSQESRTLWYKKKNLKANLELRKKYRKDYPDFWKGYLLGWLYYLYSFSPLKQLVRPVNRQFKNIFFNKQIYKKVNKSNKK